MEEDQIPKHMCKLCNKSFPCGRSLGGHMRSHVIYPSDHQQKLNNKKKLSSVNNGGNINAFIDAGYGLRENPKKTCKFKDSSEDILLHDKLCKECGKKFQSWKALFGHMKCHSEKITQTRVDEQGSWTTADQSDNETAAPSRKKRSSRKVKRYNNTVTTSTTTSSSLSFNANASLSVSEIEQEQEEVAMCLIMLSKDVSHWGDLDSIGDSSDNNSEFLKANNLDELVKFKKLRIGKLESTILEIEAESGASGNLLDVSRMKKSETQFGGLIVDENLKKSKVVEELDFHVPEVGMRKNLIRETESDQKAELGTKKHHSSKRKVVELFDPELGVNYSEIYKENFEKKSKFECASCNKAFHSYQALGGHRASHKKLKGCFGLKIDGCENSSIGTDQNLPPNPSTAADNNIPNINHEVVADASFGTKKINKGGSHECPLCFRVFSSGQALGGHKRSHLIGEAKNNQSTTSIVVQKPIPEIRDFLDLNLPAPVEEEDGSISGLGFSPWWIGSSHKHEPLLGLLSN